METKRVPIETKVTENYRVLIPKPVRDQVEINKGDKLEVMIADDGSVVLQNLAKKASPLN